MKPAASGDSAIGDTNASPFGARPGLEQLRAMLDGALPAPPMAETLGFRLADCAMGRAVFVCTPQARHLNPLGTVHGGLAATLLDSALGCAVHTTLAAEEGYTTVDLNVKYLRPVLPETGELRAEAEVVHRGRRMATAEGRLVGPDGKLYAQGSTTCMLFPVAAAPGGG